MKRLLGFWPLLTLILALAFFLRIYRVADTPHDLYVDEVAIGWNAYSILKTGKDEYGVILPLWFRSYGEYKLPVFIYLTTLAEFFVGANALAVRLPSVVLGTITVGLSLLLVNHLTQNKKLAFLTGLLLAISPMSLHFSRAGYEANVALFFITLATFLVVKGIDNKHSSQMRLIFLGTISFILALYTYNSARFFVPVFIYALVRIYHNKLKSWLHLITSKQISPMVPVILLLLAALLIPFILFTLSPAGSIRATQEMYTNDYPKNAPLTYQSMLPWTINQYFRNYTKYFSFDFLFFSGDPIGRHGTRENGVMYLWQLPFFILGLIYSVKSIINKRQTQRPVNEIFLSWLVIAPISAAFGGHNPHAVRSLNLVVPFSYFTAVGVIQLVSVISSQFSVIRKIVSRLSVFRSQNRKTEHQINNHLRPKADQPLVEITDNRKLKPRILQLLFCFTVAYFLLSYLHIYYVHYPNRTSPDWSGGYKEALDFVFAHENQYEKVALTKGLSNAYAYLFFYGQFDPSQVNISPRPQTGFGKYEFVDVPYILPKNTLYVAQPTDPSSGRLIAQIKNKSGDVQFYIWEN